MDQQQNIIRNKINYFRTMSIFVMFIMLISAVVFIVFNVALFLFDIRIQNWWIQILLYINIFTLFFTELFRLDDSTGGYKHILDTSYIGVVFCVASIMIVLKYNDQVSATNEQLGTYFLVINMLLILMKNIVRKRL